MDPSANNLTEQAWKAIYDLRATVHELRLEVAQLKNAEERLKNKVQAFEDLIQGVSEFKPEAGKLTQEERELIGKGEKIRAVRSIQYRTGLSLRLAKEFMESFF